MAKRKGYAIIRIHIQREIEVELDDEIESRNDGIMPQVEKIVAEKYGELNFDIDEPDENGWKHIKIGKVHNGVNKCMGFKKGEKPMIFGQFIPVSSRWEPLRKMIDDTEYGKQEVILEGFPDLTPEQFVEMYCKHNKCTPEKLVHRIEIDYV